MYAMPYPAVSIFALAQRASVSASERYFVSDVSILALAQRASHGCCLC